MANKILIENNKIVFEGHAEDSETCRTLTAICDALAANENFSTVKYESGYAEFERISGGDELMFDVLTTDNFYNYFPPIDLRNYATKAELAAAKMECLERAQEAKNLAQQAMNRATEARLIAQNAMTAVTELQNASQGTLNYSVEQINALLAKIDAL